MDNSAPTVGHRHIVRRRYDFPEALLVLSATGMALAMFNAFAMDVSGVLINAWIVLVATLIELAALVGIARRNGFELGLPVLDSVVFVGIVLVTTAYMIYPSMPALLPPSLHYDAIHPIVLADYIYQTNSLPHDFSGAVPPYFPPGYPVGGALMVALVSHWFGRVPFDTLHPFISFVLGLTAGLTFLIIRRAFRDIQFSVPLALLATCLLFTAWEYFPGSVNERYFFGQTFAQFFALLTFFYLMDYVSVPDLGALLLILSSLAAVLFSHPSPMVAPAFAVGIVLVDHARRDLKRAAIHASALAVGLGLVALFYVLPRWSAWVGQTGYGEAPTFGIDTIGVVLPLLGSIGFVAAMRKQWRDRCAIGFLMLVAVLAQPVALFLGHFFIPGIGIYYFEKSVYLLIYPLALFAAVALAEGMVVLNRRVPTWQLALAAWVIGVAGIPVIFAAFPPRPFAPLTEAELQVARWAKSHVDVENLAYVSPLRGDAYWIRIAVFGLSPTSPASVAAYSFGSMDYAEWRGNPGEPDYAIVRNTQRVPDDPTVTTVYRVDDSALLLKPRGSVVLPPPAGHETSFRFADMFDLTGYDLGEYAAPGGSLPITFYWRPLRWPTGRVSMFIQVLNSFGDVVARSENEMFQKRFPTQRWPVGSVVTDTWQVSLPPELSAGEYTLEVAVFDKSSGIRFPVNAPDRPSADRIILGPIRVVIPAPSAAELQSANQLDLRFGDSIILRAYALFPSAVKPEDSVNLNLYWESSAPIMHDYTVFVHLLNSSGRIVAQVDAPPQSGTYPTSTWRPNEVVKDPYYLKIPKDTPAGDYRIEFGLYTASDLKRVPVADGDHVMIPQTITVK